MCEHLFRLAEVEHGVVHGDDIEDIGGAEVQEGEDADPEGENSQNSQKDTEEDEIFIF